MNICIMEVKCRLISGIRLCWGVGMKMGDHPFLGRDDSAPDRCPFSMSAFSIGTFI